MEYQLAIVGGGPAGYTAAESAAHAGLSVVLFEKQSLGGVCLNEGCIPTKTLLYSAKTLDSALQGTKYGVSVAQAQVDLPKVIARKQKVVRKLVLGVKSKLTSKGVTIVQGEAYITDQHTITCNGETYNCQNLMLCTGSETFIPPIDGVQNVDYWTHREALSSKELPQSIAIVGGGVIGIEFASFYNSMGTQVYVVEMQDEILPGMDSELCAMLRAEYAKRGVKFVLGARVTKLSQTQCSEEQTDACGNQKETLVRIDFQNADGEQHIVAHKLLLSVGRRPATNACGLENLNLQKTEKGNIVVNSKMQTSLEGVYACGDITGFSMLAHTAVREAEVAVNTITGKDDAMSYKAIPAVVYTNPEIAAVGQTEETLKQQGIGYTTITLPMAFSGRFVAENEGVNGVCKLLISNNNTILGAHILGNPASEIIALAGMAIELNITTQQWKKIIMPHPTVAEIFKEML